MATLDVALKVMTSRTQRMLVVESPKLCETRIHSLHSCGMLRKVGVGGSVIVLPSSTALAQTCEPCLH